MRVQVVRMFMVINVDFILPCEVVFALFYCLSG